MEDNYNNLLGVIRDFCQLVDHVEGYRRGIWLLEMEQLLPQIADGMSRLKMEVEYSFFVLPDLEYRFRMYTRLKSFLGDLDDYVLAGDGDESDERSGSLADDFTDIYFELSRGLDLLDADPTDPTPALTLWHTGHVLHWHQHVDDALKRLYELGAMGLLG